MIKHMLLKRYNFTEAISLILDESNRHTGRVKSWSTRRGYGFIVYRDKQTLDDNDDCKREIFVHYTGVIGHGVRNLYEGQEVSFKVSLTGKGGFAYNVKPVEAWYDEYQ